MSGSVLREAAAQGDVAYLRELLETGGNPCSTDDNGLNALHFAVWNGHVEAVELLVVNDVGCPTLPPNVTKEWEASVNKWLQGYIARDNHDGTYNVNFDDGSREEQIEKRKVKQAEKKDGTLYPKPKEGRNWKVNMVCIARYSHKRDLHGMSFGDGSYGGAAFNRERYEADMAIQEAREHLIQLEKNRLKKKPMASCIPQVTEAGWTHLHICAMGALNDVACAQLLLEAGVSPLVRDLNQRTAYDVAVLSNNEPLAALLRRPRPSFDTRRRAMRTYRNRCLLQDKPKRPPPPYYATIAGEPPLPEVIIDTDDEAEETEAVLDEDAIKQMTGKDLRAALTERELSTRGMKAALRVRLLDAVNREASQALLALEAEEVEEEEVDLSGKEHAREWLQLQTFLADQRMDNWDGTGPRPVQLAEPPKELLIPEHLQLPYAKENFTIGTARKDKSRRKRGPHIIHNLIFAVREADRNFERREFLAAEQAQFVDQEAVAKAERNKLKSTRDRRNVTEGMSLLAASAGGGVETGGYAI